MKVAHKNQINQCNTIFDEHNFLQRNLILFVSLRRAFPFRSFSCFFFVIFFHISIFGTPLSTPLTSFLFSFVFVFIFDIHFYETQWQTKVIKLSIQIEKFHRHAEETMIEVILSVCEMKTKRTKTKMKEKKNERNDEETKWKCSSDCHNFGSHLLNSDIGFVTRDPTAFGENDWMRSEKWIPFLLNETKRLWFGEKFGIFVRLFVYSHFTDEQVTWKNDIRVRTLWDFNSFFAFILSAFGRPTDFILA